MVQLMRFYRHCIFTWSHSQHTANKSLPFWVPYESAESNAKCNSISVLFLIILSLSSNSLLPTNRWIRPSTYILKVLISPVIFLIRFGLKDGGARGRLEHQRTLSSWMEFSNIDNTTAEQELPRHSARSQERRTTVSVKWFTSSPLLPPFTSNALLIATTI